MRYLIFLALLALSGCKVYSDELLFKENDDIKTRVPPGSYKGCDSSGFCYFFQIMYRSGRAYYVKLGLPSDEGEISFYQEKGNDTALLAIRRPGNMWQYALYRTTERQLFDIDPFKIDAGWWKTIEGEGVKLNWRSWRDRVHDLDVEVKNNSALMKIYKGLSPVSSAELKSKYEYKSYVISISSEKDFKDSEVARKSRIDEASRKDFARLDHRSMVINAALNSYRAAFPSRVTITGPTTAIYGHPVLGPLYRITLDARNVNCSFIQINASDCKWDQSVSIQAEHELAAIAQSSAPLPVNEHLEQRIFGPNNLNFASPDLADMYRRRYVTSNSNAGSARSNSEDAFDRSVRESERINCAHAIVTPGPVGELGRDLNCR